MLEVTEKQIPFMYPSQRFEQVLMKNQNVGLMRIILSSQVCQVLQHTFYSFLRAPLGFNNILFTNSVVLKQINVKKRVEEAGSKCIE